MALFCLRQGTIERLPRCEKNRDLSLRHGQLGGPQDAVDLQPRSRAYLTPTSQSWLGEVVRFLALITQQKLRRGIHGSVENG